MFTAQVKPRRFLDTRATRAPGPRAPRKKKAKAPPAPPAFDRVVPHSGEVVYASDDESVGRSSDDESEGEEARSTGSLDDWIVADDACLAADGDESDQDAPAYSSEARWAAAGAGLLKELRSRPSAPWRPPSRNRASAERSAARARAPRAPEFHAAGGWSLAAPEAEAAKVHGSDFDPFAGAGEAEWS